MNRQFYYSRNTISATAGIFLSAMILFFFFRVSRKEFGDIFYIVIMCLFIFIQTFTLFFNTTIRVQNDLIILPRHIYGLGAMYFGQTANVPLDRLISITKKGHGNNIKITIDYMEENKKKSTVLYTENFRNNESEEFVNHIQQTIKGNFTR